VPLLCCGTRAQPGVLGRGARVSVGVAAGLLGTGSVQGVLGGGGVGALVCDCELCVCVCVRFCRRGGAFVGPLQPCVTTAGPILRR
jgi:hypothetical protein